MTTHRQRIIREADKWLTARPDKRAQVIIIAESDSIDGPHLSFSAGGDYNLLIDALCETIQRQPQFASILADAIEAYNARAASQN